MHKIHRGKTSGKKRKQDVVSPGLQCEFVLHRMNISLECATGYMLGLRNDDLNEYKWCLCVTFARPDLRQKSGLHYLGSLTAFKTTLTFPGPGESNGRDAMALETEDFEQWKQEMLQTGSPLYMAFAELMRMVGSIQPCMYCRGGTGYRSYVCSSCLDECHSGCKVCQDFIGKLNKDGVHENCEKCDK